MIDFTVLSEHFVYVVMIACLVVGYIMKHASFLKKIPNNDIPAILAVFGMIVNSFVSGLSVDSMVYGAVMGLASTGMHQAFKTFINNE